MTAMGHSDHSEPVLSMDDYLDEAIAEIDGFAEHLYEVRTRMAAHRHALRMAEAPEVVEAGEDYFRRLEEDRPYERPIDAKDLVEAIRAGR